MRGTLTRPEIDDIQGHIPEDPDDAEGMGLGGYQPGSPTGRAMKELQRLTRINRRQNQRIKSLQAELAKYKPVA